MRIATAPALALFALGSALARAQEPTLLAVEPSGLVPLKGETSVSIRGLAGKIVVWGGDDEGVEFDLKEADKESPLRVLTQDGTLLLEPPDGPAVKRSLFLKLPSGIGLRLEADATTVELTNVRGRSDIAGKDLKVQISGTSGSVTLELQGGIVNASDTQGDMVVRGREWTIHGRGVQGRVGLYGGPGTANLTGLGGRLDAEIEQVRLTADGAEGEVMVRAKEGGVVLSGARAGGDLRMSGSSLSLMRGEGVFTVTTDAQVKLSELRSDLVIDGDGAHVEGTGITGDVQGRNHDGSFTLSKVKGAVRIDGTALMVSIKEAEEARIETQASTVDLASIGGKVEVSNDGGDVRLTQVFGETSVNAFGGNVRIVDQGGALQLSCDAGETIVGWAVLPPGTKSSIENLNGPVSVQLPTGGNGFRIEASTTSGRIESPFRRVLLSGDGTDAQGYVGTDTSTLVRVKATGDIRFTGGPNDIEDGTQAPR